MAKIKRKTNRAAAKRFKITGSGRAKRKKAYLRHNMRKRSPDAKRNLRKKTLVTSADSSHIQRLLPNG